MADTGSGSMIRQRWRRPLAGVAILAIVAFGGALRSPFQFDDLASIPGNATIRDLRPSVALVPPSGISVSGRPVVNYSFAINYALNDALGVDQRPDPAGPDKTIGYRVVNIALHLLSGLLLFAFLRRTLGAPRVPEWARTSAEGIAGTVAAIWLVHPIQSEAVAYVVQRTELLVSFFYLATLYASIRAWDSPTQGARLRWYVAGVAACLLGMGSKEVMVSAPLAVVLYDRAFRLDRWSQLREHRSRLWFYGALFLTLVALAAIAGGARADTVGFAHAISWHEYLRSQGWAILHYLRLVFWPDALTFDYGARPVLNAWGTIGLAILMAAGMATMAAWRGTAWVAFWGAWFFMLLGPSSSIVPIQTEIAAERRMYLALAPVLVVVALGCERLLRRASDPTQARRYARWGLIAIIVALTARSARRTALYNDPEALWRDAVARMPANPRAYNNVAFSVHNKDTARVREAEALLRSAIAVDSTYITAWTNLAEFAMRQDRDEEALELLQRALRINPDAVEATLRLGGLLVKTGDPAAGISFLERATAVYPTEDGFATLATGYLALGRLNEAALALRQVIAINPDRDDAVVYLGTLLSGLGKADEAIPYLEAASRRIGASGRTLALLALTYAQVGRPREASDAAVRAAGIAGTDATAHVILGRTMLRLRRVPDAERFLTEAVRLDPRDPEAITRLGIAKAAGGNRAEAIRLLHEALRIRPGYIPAQTALSRLPDP